MRKAVENLLVWFVPIAILAFAAGTAAFVLHDREILASVAEELGLPPVQLGVYLKLSQSLIYTATNFVAAAWLALQQHSSFGRRILWSLFGLASGLWAVAIWLLVLLSERRTVAGS